MLERQLLNEAQGTCGVPLPLVRLVDRVARMSDRAQHNVIPCDAQMNSADAQSIATSMNRESILGRSSKELRSDWSGRRIIGSENSQEPQLNDAVVERRWRWQ